MCDYPSVEWILALDSYPMCVSSLELDLKLRYAIMFQRIFCGSLQGS